MIARYRNCFRSRWRGRWSAIRMWAATMLILGTMLGCRPAVTPPPTTPQAGQSADQKATQANAAITSPELPHLIRPDDRKALKALRSRGAIMPRNPDGNVIEVALPEGATDDDLALILKLHMVRSVSINNANATAAGIRQLVEIHNLRALKADRTQVDDATLAGLAPLPLEELSLAGTPISDGGMQHLLRQDRLKRLDLSWTSIGDQGLEALSKVKSLEDLNLSFTDISDQSVELLGRFSGLKRVVLEGADVSEQAARRLRELLPEAQIIHSALDPALPKRIEPKPPAKKLLET